MTRAVHNNGTVIVGFRDTELDSDLAPMERHPLAGPLAPGVITRHRPRRARPLWPVAVALVASIAAVVLTTAGVTP